MKSQRDLRAHSCLTFHLTESIMEALPPCAVWQKHSAFCHANCTRGPDVITHNQQKFFHGHINIATVPVQTHRRVVQIRQKERIHVLTSHDTQQLLGFFLVANLRARPVPALRIQNSNMQSLSFTKLVSCRPVSVRVSPSLTHARRRVAAAEATTKQHPQHDGCCERTPQVQNSKSQKFTIERGRRNPP